MRRRRRKNWCIFALNICEVGTGSKGERLGLKRTRRIIEGWASSLAFYASILFDTRNQGRQLIVDCFIL